MPDSVRIGIDSTFNPAGVNAASTSLQTLDQHLKSYGSAAQQINGINEQFAASQQQATHATMGHNAGVLGLINTYRNWVMAAGTVAGAAMTVKKAYDFSEQGAGILRLEASFSNVARNYDVNSQSILNSMRAASQGTISDVDLMLAANRAMLLGVSTNADELGRITAVAIERGRAMGLSASEAIDRVYTGIGRLSPKILDDLGIITNATDRYSEYAKAHNMSADAIDDYTKREIIKNAILEDSKNLLDENGAISRDTASSYERLSASWSNFLNTTKSSAAGAFPGMNDLLSSNLSQMADYQKAKAAYLASPEAYNERGFTKLPTTSRAFVDAATEYYARQQQQAAIPSYENIIARQKMQTLPADETVQTADYKNLLDAGLDIAKVTETYTEKTAALNEKLEEESEKLDKITKRYGAASEKAKEQREKVDDIRDAITDLGKDYEKNTDMMALGMLKNKDATDEQQFAFARAAGLISQDAYETSTALEKITTAYMSGKINAESYAQGVGSLKNIIGGMSETAVNTYIDVWIRVHGGMPGGSYAGPGANTTTTSSALEALRESTGGGRAGGGPLFPGVTLVGDAPGGGMTPYTEAIVNGYVIDAQTTRKLYEAGLLEGATSRRVGGDLFGTGVFTGGGSGGTSQVSSIGVRRFNAGATSSSDTMVRAGSPAGDTGGVGTSEVVTTSEIAADTASLAATVAEQAVNTSSMVVAAQSTMQQNMQSQTNQTTQTQERTSENINAEIRELQRLIRKQATKDDLYALFHSGQQQSI
jgi:hypothetical protein